jgi:arylsulfatase A-like enzyme
MGLDDEWRMIVRGFDKMVIDRAGEVTHLYNLGQDPLEMENLATSRQHRRSKDELMALIRDWQKRTNDGRSGSGLRKRGFSRSFARRCSGSRSIRTAGCWRG